MIDTSGPGLAAGAPLATWQGTHPEEDATMKKLDLELETLEERIAPDPVGGGNPGNNNPPLNNTNNSGNEGTGGRVSTGR
jgi:hypothetical protein